MSVVCVCVCVSCGFCFCKQKTAYEMRISDWSSDVCSSDLPPQVLAADRVDADAGFVQQQHPWPRHQRAGQAELLLHAARQLARQARGERRQPGELEQLGEQFSMAFGIHAAQPGIQAHVLHDRKVLIQAERSEEHTSELQSLMRNSYAVFCLI